MQETGTAASPATTEAAEFQQRLHTLTPTTWALHAVVAINVAVWLANLAAGMSAFNPSAADLLRWGANSAWAVLREHEGWRLLTATFLHGGLVHLALNLWALWEAGRLLNRLQGNAQFLLIYLGSALVGSAASLHFSAQVSISVGASGAVFGVLGALLVAMRRHRRELPAMLGRNLLASQGVFLVYALVQGFVREGVDNAAHVGGLLGGAAMAALLVARIDRSGRAAQARARALAAAALAGVTVAVLAATAPQPQVDHQRRFETQAAFQRVLPRLQAAMQALADDANAQKQGRLTEAQVDEAIRSRHLPAAREVDQALSGLQLPPGDPAAGVLADFRVVSANAVRVLELQLQRAQPGSDAAAIDGQMAQLSEEAAAASERIRQRAGQPQRP
jgi:rhomboid protease GluP